MFTQRSHSSQKQAFSRVLLREKEPPDLLPVFFPIIRIGHPGYRDRGIYGVGTARVTNEKDVLIPMDVADGWELEEVMQGDEAQSLIHRAKETGGRIPE